MKYIYRSNLEFLKLLIASAIIVRDILSIKLFKLTWALGESEIHTFFIFFFSLVSSITEFQDISNLDKIARLESLLMIHHRWNYSDNNTDDKDRTISEKKNSSSNQ